MFDFVKSRRTLVTVILAIIAVPFAFFGIDFYFRGGGGGDRVAEVAGTQITQREFGDALRQQQERVREMMGGKVDAGVLDSPEVRKAVLDRLIDERVLYSAALKQRMIASPAQVRGAIAEMEQFKDAEGKFSKERYQRWLQTAGMAEDRLWSLLSRDIVLARARVGFASTAFLPDAVADRLYRLGLQQREVSQVIFNPSQFALQVKLEPDAARAFYEANQKRFTVPERVRLEYIVLNADDMARDEAITPEEVKQHFEANRAQFGVEERRARHILVSVPENASAEQKAQTKAKAEQLLARAKKSPAAFADLARKSSDDPGSAAEGGDLGFAPRGRMVAPFDNALFAMQEGEISGPVETQYGYHIIKLEAVRPKFEEIRAKVEEDLRRHKSNRRFADTAESFSNLVYEQPDSLTPALEAFKLKPHTTGWMTRDGGEVPLLNNEKFLRAVFSDDVLKNGRNSEAIEVAPNVLVSARLVERQPEMVRPFSEVESEIVAELRREKAAELARKEGEAALAKLEQGERLAVAWSAPAQVSRERRQGLHPEAARAVFSADAAKLPAYVGVPAPDGRYVIYRISRVTEADEVDPAARRQLAQQLDQFLGREEEAARLSSLKAKADVRINAKALERNP
jgi:peptidyl-prolyl cis-trans isomerase D